MNSLVIFALGLLGICALIDIAAILRDVGTATSGIVAIFVKGFWGLLSFALMIAVACVLTVLAIVVLILFGVACAVVSVIEKARGLWRKLRHR